MKPLRLIAAAVALMAASACESRTPTAASPQPPQPRPTAVIDPSSSPISAAAEREIIRRQEAMRRADEAALRAARQMSEGDYEGAMSGYRGALGELPR